MFRWNKPGLTLTLIVALTATALPAAARTRYMTDFNNRYSAAGTSLDSCTLCHTNIPARNSYGAAYRSSGRNFATIEPLDSDGDGFTNLNEIIALTFPGNAGSVPAPPVCTDADQDGYAVQGGVCGPVDSNDGNPAVRPGVVESCTDGIDNNGNGLIDAADTQSVSCFPTTWHPYACNAVSVAHPATSIPNAIVQGANRQGGSFGASVIGTSGDDYQILAAVAADVTIAKQVAVARYVAEDQSETWFTLTDNGWQIWNRTVPALVGYGSQFGQLKSLYSGMLMPGRFQVWNGYYSNAGEVFVCQTPIDITIGN